MPYSTAIAVLEKSRLVDMAKRAVQNSILNSTSTNLVASSRTKGGSLDMKYIGIDPGKTGAVAIIDGTKLSFHDCPLINVGKSKTGLDFHAMATILDNAVCGDSAVAIIERVAARPGQGVTSMFNFGMNFGAWQGILASIPIPYELVTPQAWKKKMMPGQPKEKDASRGVAKQLFPQCADSLKLKKHNGRADALLMAEYLRRHRFNVVPEVAA